MGITQAQLDEATFGQFGLGYQPIKAGPVVQQPKGFVYKPTTQGFGRNNYTLPKNNGTGWMGKGGYLDTGAGVVNALSAGLGAYTGLQQLGLAKKQFAFEKGLANRNILNQGILANNQMDNATNVGLALAGNTLTSGQKDLERSKTLGRHVNTSAIG